MDDVVLESGSDPTTLRSHPKVLRANTLPFPSPLPYLLLLRG